MVESYRPANLNEALQIRNHENIMVFAGGSDLMVKHRLWGGATSFSSPILFIGHLGELQGISIDDDKITIGSACTLAQIINNESISRQIKLPLAQMASPAIRNIATIGGNICNSSPAGDTLPMLYTLDAWLILQSEDSTQMVAIKDFITGPGQNRLQSNQILTGVEIPRNEYQEVYYKKVGSRRANSISKLSFYAAAHADSCRVHGVKIAFGAVAPTVIRSPEAEELLKGILKTDIPAVFPAVKAYYADLLQPMDDIRSTGSYRRQVSLQLLEHYLVEELSK